MTDFVAIDAREGIATLTVATDAAHAITPALIHALADAVDVVRADGRVRAVVLVGGSRYFSSGAPPALFLDDDPAGSVADLVRTLPSVLLSFPVPTIAAMAGHAVGGGFTMGLWCDVMVLSEESLYGANYMALGFTPGLGTTVCLEEAVGAPLAREMLFTGRMMRGGELRQSGGPLAHAVHPRVEVEERAYGIAREMAQVPRTSLELLKQTLSARRRARMEAAVDEEIRMHVSSFGDSETRNALAERFAAITTRTGTSA